MSPSYLEDDAMITYQLVRSPEFIIDNFEIEQLECFKALKPVTPMTRKGEELMKALETEWRAKLLAVSGFNPPGNYWLNMIENDRLIKDTCEETIRVAEKIASEHYMSFFKRLSISDFIV